MSARPWFDEGSHKDSLLAKIVEDNFYISLRGGVPAKVTKLIYAGYKVIYPTGLEENINPNTFGVKDITKEEYDALVGPYLEQEDKKRAEIQEVKRKEAEELARVKALQASCLHDEIFIKETARAAGFSSEDYHCCSCDKFLRCSMSTAYENDPNDIIGDWPWFLRYCQKTYGNYVPKRSDYEIFEG